LIINKAFLFIPFIAEEKVPADETAEVWMHLQNASLWQPHGARHGSEQRQTHSTG
jgi:hypothetical protein